MSADWLFTLDQVHEVSLTLSLDAITALQSSPYEYVEGQLSINGEEVGVIGARVKGRLGSYRELTGKCAWKLNINQYEDKRFHGLEKLSLNNMVQDASMVHEYLAYGLYNAAGVVAPKVGYAWVTVNDVPYGLYTLVEVYDDVWLDKSYDDPSGNLYDGDYYLDANGSYTLIDFHPNTDHLFDLDEGEDVGHSDIFNVTETLQSNAGGGNFYEELNTVVDMRQFSLMWAADVWLGHYDSYSFNDNNYRVYFDPSDGRARFHPWDPDWAFYATTPITTPSGDLAYWCKADHMCHALFDASMDEVFTAVDEWDMEAALDEASALIWPYVEADPRREYGTGSVTSGQDSVRTWLQTRSSTIRGTSGL